MLKIGTQLGLKALSQSFAKPSAVRIIKAPNLLAVNAQPIRNTSFFNRLTQQQLWSGVTSISNAGKRRGRGRLGDTRGRRNLNAGQKVGEGKIRVQWPGLNCPIEGNRGIKEIKRLPDAEQKPVDHITALRIRRSKKVHPLDRGWSGKTVKGRRIGPPDPVQDENFEGFQSIVIDQQLKRKMTSTLGRKREFFSMVATGNGNGLIGVSVAKSADSNSAVRQAKNRAARRLITIDLVEKNNINHDFFSEYGRTRLFVFKKPNGFGLRCQRVLAALCKLIGIENIYVKIEGPKNTKAIVRAFIVGLLRQKSYQEIADEKRLHLVEFKEETNNFPNVLASPQECLTLAEVKKNPVLFEEYIMGGKLVHKSNPKVPFYKKLPSWSVYLRKTLYCRNHDKVRVYLLAKYGGHISHLSKIYPECRGSPQRLNDR